MIKLGVKFGKFFTSFFFSINPFNKVVKNKDSCLCEVKQLA